MWWLQTKSRAGALVRTQKRNVFWTCWNGFRVLNRFQIGFGKAKNWAYPSYCESRLVGLPSVTRYPFLWLVVSGHGAGYKSRDTHCELNCQQNCTDVPHAFQKNKRVGPANLWLSTPESMARLRWNAHARYFGDVTAGLGSGIGFPPPDGASTTEQFHFLLLLRLVRLWQASEKEYAAKQALQRAW